MTGPKDVAGGVWEAIKRLASIDDLLRQVSDKIPMRLSEIQKDIRDQERNVAIKLDSTCLSYEQNDRDVEGRLNRQIDKLSSEVAALSKEVGEMRANLSFLIGRADVYVSPKHSRDTSLPPQSLKSIPTDVVDT